MKPHKLFRNLLIFLAIVVIVIFQNHSVNAKNVSGLSNLPTASDVIGAINFYRQQNGLAPLTTNSLLSSLAQGQSDYQSSIGNITHTGPGGTTPQQRASSAGYGGGSFFYMSEIIYGGYEATTLDALTWWQNSSLHNSIMLDSKYTEIGAGVATDGTSVYFTAELAGTTGGGSTSGGSEESTEGTTGENNEITPTQQAPISIPVQKASPAPDGSISHVVQQGQSPWTIAAIYEVDLDQMLSLNGLTRNSFVSPGDVLLIKPAVDQTATSTPDPKTPTTEPFSSATIEPEEVDEKILGTPYSFIAATEIPTEPTTTSILEEKPTLTGRTNKTEGNGNQLVNTLLIAAVVILILVISISIFSQKQTQRTTKNDLLE